MKIAHVIISNFYREGYGYQENILPKKHAQLGYDVVILTKDSNGKAYGSEYINDRGVRVRILNKNTSIYTKIWGIKTYQPRTRDLYQALEEEKPDIIFVHGIFAVDHISVVRYKKAHSETKIFVDNHSDYYNNKTYNTIKGKLFFYTVQKMIVKKLVDCCEVAWGVTPWRVKFLNEVYKLPKEKTGLLVMGGDEDYIHFDKKNEIRQNVRLRYDIPQDALLIITGGKITKDKNIHILTSAVENLKKSDVYLLVFGKCESDMKDYPETITSERVKYIGWIPSNDVYDLYIASDFGFFPGTHSVLWEQACACGIPCAFKDWDGGFNHVDLGGNCVLIKEVDEVNIIEVLKSYLCNEKVYNRMKLFSENEAVKTFSYLNIAKRSIIRPQ